MWFLKKKLRVLFFFFLISEHDIWVLISFYNTDQAQLDASQKPRPQLHLPDTCKVEQLASKYNKRRKSEQRRAEVRHREVNISLTGRLRSSRSTARCGTWSSLQSRVCTVWSLSPLLGHSCFGRSCLPLWEKRSNKITQSLLQHEIPGFICCL